MTRRNLLLTSLPLSAAPSLAAVSPWPEEREDLEVLPASRLGLDKQKLALAGDAVDAAVKAGVPGAVLLVGRHGSLALRRGFGNAAVTPGKRPLTPHTLFDLASLTKVVATTTAVALLTEAGQLDLDSPIARHLPPFAAAGPERSLITPRHLLTHTAGVPAGGNYQKRQVTLPQIVEEIARSRRMGAPGEKFIYSDYSAILLQALVETLSGQTLDRFCQERIFTPLEMRDTLYNPQGKFRERCAATAPEDSPEHRGVVHDPTARALGGVSGNAGLFSTGDDLARFARMMLGEGTSGTARLLKPETIWRFTCGQALTGGARALGWDRDSGYSIRGGLPYGSYGHTGFTGTSLWLDPATGIFIILLTAVVHNPDEKVSVLALRHQLSSLVADAVLGPAPVAKPTHSPRLSRPPQIRTGLEALIRDNYRLLAGRRLGLVCNHTALDTAGNHIVDLLAGSGKVELVSLFGPEHSIRGDVDASADDGRDARTGLPVYSLYNLQLPREQRYRPTPEQLQGVDTLVYDIQDIGARYYTYIATLGYCMEEAAKLGIRVVVLDRPNPLGGELMEGPLLDRDLVGGFTGYHHAPITHGMTVGELARMFSKEKAIPVALEVVEMQGWNRLLRYDETGLPWVNPSPNMRSQRAAWLYPGVGLLEVLPVSVGRGTDTPFELFGAPFIDPVALALDLRRRALPGVSFVPVRFTPVSSVHKDKLCGGVHVNLWDRDSCHPSELGLHLLDSLLRLYPEHLTPSTVTRLRGMIGAKRTVDSLLAAQPLSQILAAWQEDVAAFRQRRSEFLLYP